MSSALNIDFAGLFHDLSEKQVQVPRTVNMKKTNSINFVLSHLLRVTLQLEGENAAYIKASKLPPPPSFLEKNRWFYSLYLQVKYFLKNSISLLTQQTALINTWTSIISAIINNLKYICIFIDPIVAGFKTSNCPSKMGPIVA